MIQFCLWLDINDRLLNTLPNSINNYIINDHGIDVISGGRAAAILRGLAETPSPHMAEISRYGTD